MKNVLLLVLIISCAFRLTAQDKLVQAEKKLFAYKHEGLWGIKKDNGKKLTAPVFQEILSFNNKLAAAKKDNKWGFINYRGKEKIGFRFDTVSSGYEKGYALAGKKESHTYKWSLLNRKGELLFPFSYYSLYRISPQYLYAEDDNGAGIIDYDGNIIITPEYKEITFSGASEFQLEEFPHWQLRSEAGSLLLDLKADTVILRNMLRDSTGVFSKKNNRYYSVSLSGQISPSRPPEALPATSPTPAPKEEGKTDMLPGLKYTWGPVNDSMYLAFTGSGYKIVSLNKAYSQEVDIDTAFSYNEGMFLVRRSGLYGFIDGYGRIKISMQYDTAMDFHDGRAAIKLNNKWGFVDKQDKITAQPFYDRVTSFRDSVAFVKKNDRWNTISVTGKVMNDSWYDTIERNPPHFFLKKSGYTGLADKWGKETIIPKYKELKDYKRGFVVARYLGKYGVIDYKQNFIIPFEYDKIIYDPENRIFLTRKEGNKQRVKISRD